MAYVTKSCNGDSWGKHYMLKLECNETSTSTTNNTSTVSVSLYIKADNSAYSYTGYNTYFTATIDGAGQSQISKTMTVNANDWYLIGTCPAKTITHNTDGSKSIYIQAVMNTGYSRIYETTIDATFTLTTIPRYFTKTPTLTYISATETIMNFNWSTSETCNKVILYYKLSSASSYSSTTIYNNSTGTTSGSGSLTGLAAGGTYNIYAKCTRKDSGLASDSATLTQISIAYPSISKIETAAITIPAPGSSIDQVLTLNNPLSRSITVYAKNANSSGTLIKSGTTSGTSITLALAANDMYTAIGAANTSGTIAYYCVYNDGTNNHISAMANGTYATSAANCGPTVSANPTYTNTNSTHTSLVGSDTIIQGQSSFSITSPAVTARGGASIAKYYFKIGNGSYESATAATKTYSSISLSGTVSISVYAEDTRGYTSTVKTAYMRVLAYSAPNANISVTRNGYTTNATITVISATRSVLSKSSATSTDVNNWRGNTSSNKISLAISPTGPSLAASVIGGTAATISNASVSITNASLTSAYTITVNISDRIITKTLTFTLNKATPIMSVLNTNRVGINKMDPSCELDVNGDTKTTNLNVTGYAENFRPKSIVAYQSRLASGDFDHQYPQNRVSKRLDIASSSMTTQKPPSGDGFIESFFWDNSGKYDLQIGLSHNVKRINQIAFRGRDNADTWPDWKLFLDMIYPIGSIYISIVNTNPANYFGGTWEVFGTGKTLVGVDTNDTDFNTVQKTGGAKTSSYTPAGTVQSHTLTLNEIPSHNHGGIAGYFGNGTFSKSFNWLSTNSGSFIQYETLPDSGGSQGHSHGFSGTAANISTVQPYVTVYMWRRTA